MSVIVKYGNNILKRLEYGEVVSIPCDSTVMSDDITAIFTTSGRFSCGGEVTEVLAGRKITIPCKDNYMGTSIEFEAYDMGNIEGSEGLVYTLSDDYTHYICTGIGTCTDEEITIASHYEDLPVKAIGNMAFNNTNVTRIVLPDTITALAENIFGNFSKVVRIVLSRGVSSVNASSFNLGYNLTSIEVNNANPHYKSIDGNLYSKDGKKLVKYSIGKTEEYFKIPETVESIETNALIFSTLARVTIPGSVTLIGDRAFRRCDRLTSVDIPGSVTNFGEYVFADCTKLTDVRIGNGVTQIPRYAFDNCKALTNVQIHNSVISIDEGAFNGCDALESIVIPANVTGIGKSSFYGCINLINVDIGNGVTSIGEYAFSQCSRLTNISIPNSVTSIGKAAFQHCIKLTSVNIPNVITTLNDYVFDGCTSLESISIPNNITRIGEDAFFNCKKLTNITIPDSVQIIGASAFSMCENLTSITIGKGVTRIAMQAFYGCASLTNISYTGTTSEWNSIIKQIYWKDKVPATYVQCSDGTVAL